MSRQIDRERVAEKVRALLVELLGVSDNQLTLDADIVKDLGAEADDLEELDLAIESAFNVESFAWAWSTWMETDEPIRVGDLINSVIDRLVNIQTEEFR